MRRSLGFLATGTVLAVLSAGLVAPQPASAVVALAPPEVGARPNATRIGFPLGDRLQASVVSE